MNFKKNFISNALLLTLMGISIQSCKKETISGSLPEDQTSSRAISAERGFAENDMVMYWNDKVATVLGVAMTQPNRTRFFAITQIAVYDALNNIKPKYERYALFDREQHADPDAAVASAAYWAIKLLNRQGSFPVDAWLAESLATIPDSESKTKGIALGKRSAEAIVAKRSTDGFTQVIASSVLPANGTIPGAYQSTLAASNWVPTANQVAFRVVPNWGTVMQPYVLESNHQFRPISGPYAITSDEYTADYIEVKSKGARVGSTRTTEETTKAYFWSENRPSIIWNQLVRESIKNKKMDAWKTARLFVLSHVALAESINSVLNAGYHFYSWRPETAIRLGNTDGNNNTVGDPTWLPFLSETPVFVTPPTPGYPNGFASFGGSVTEILRLFYGTDETSITMTTTSANPAVPMPKPSFHFTSFSQASWDYALSMIYTGWDSRKSVTDGLQMGRQISNYIFTHHFREED
jgi:hypothetical protein